jgi:hypothetical protein
VGFRNLNRKNRCLPVRRIVTGAGLWLALRPNASFEFGTCICCGNSASQFNYERRSRTKTADRTIRCSRKSHGSDRRRAVVHRTPCPVTTWVVISCLTGRKSANGCKNRRVQYIHRTNAALWTDGRRNAGKRNDDPTQQNPMHPKSVQWALELIWVPCTEEELQRTRRVASAPKHLQSERLSVFRSHVAASFPVRCAASPRPHRRE